MSAKENPFCNCLYYSVNALSRAITKQAEEAFAPTGLSPSYGFVLMLVNKNPGICPGELSKQMLLAPSTVTRFLEKLELKGYVERKQVGRGSEVFPTQKSKDLSSALRKAWKTLYDSYTEKLGVEKATELTASIYQTVGELESADQIDSNQNK